jgi:hypothetical protein
VKREVQRPEQELTKSVALDEKRRFEITAL